VDGAQGADEAYEGTGISAPKKGTEAPDGVKNGRNPACGSTKSGNCRRRISSSDIRGAEDAGAAGFGHLP
jgi:hypothetical protein